MCKYLQKDGEWTRSTFPKYLHLHWLSHIESQEYEHTVVNVTDGHSCSKRSNYVLIWDLTITNNQS